jgi:hypothetical protein
MMNVEQVGEMIVKGNERTRRKPALAPLFDPFYQPRIMMIAEQVGGMIVRGNRSI